jgi:type VI secretion system protein ImpC
MRAPYDEHRESEAFAYDEAANGLSASSYLWGNPAYLLASRIADAFARHGWCAAIRGAEMGGLTSGLPVHTVANEGRSLSRVGPTEVSVSDRRLRELDSLGFIALCQDKRADMAVFFRTPSAAKPKLYDTDEMTAAARYGTRLEYVLVAAQILRCLKSMVRDRPGAETADECERRLNGWLAGYVAGGGSTTAKTPLRSATLTVKSSAEAGTYVAALVLDPGYQLQSLPFPLRFVTQLSRTCR